MKEGTFDLLFAKTDPKRPGKCVWIKCGVVHVGPTSVQVKVDALPIGFQVTPEFVVFDKYSRKEE